MAYEILRGQTQFKYGMSNPEQLVEWLQENPEIIGFSFIGRSNVGKSSTINSLFGNGVARTSKTPGRTREINIFTFELSYEGKIVEGLPPLYLFDLPGYGHADVSRAISKKWDLLMGTFFNGVCNEVVMMNIQDARHPNQKADIEFHKYLKDFNFDTFLIFNKMDKLKKQKERAALNKMKPQLFKEYKWVKQVFFASAETKDGLKQVESSMIQDILHKVELLDRKLEDQEIEKEDQQTEQED